MRRRRKGATGLAYGLMVGMVAVAALAAITGGGRGIDGVFGSARDEMGTVLAGGGPAAPSPSASASPSAAASPSALPSPSPVYATWSGADVSPGITLSGGSLTATLPGASNNLQGGRAALGLSSGKHYWEVTHGGFAATIGFAVAGWHVGNGVPSTTPPDSVDYNGGNVIGWYSYSGAFNPGSSGVSVAAFPAGTVIRIALDMDSGQAWFGDNAAGCQWRAQGGGTTAAPPAGTPLFTGLTGARYPAFMLQAYGGSPSSVTANFGASGFACPAPPGFRAGIYP